MSFYYDYYDYIMNFKNENYDIKIYEKYIINEFVKNTNLSFLYYYTYFLDLNKDKIITKKQFTSNFYNEFVKFSDIITKKYNKYLNIFDIYPYQESTKNNEMFKINFNLRTYHKQNLNSNFYINIIKNIIFFIEKYNINISNNYLLFYIFNKFEDF